MFLQFKDVFLLGLYYSELLEVYFLKLKEQKCTWMENKQQFYFIKSNFIFFLNQDLLFLLLCLNNTWKSQWIQTQETCLLWIFSFNFHLMYEHIWLFFCNTLFLFFIFIFIFTWLLLQKPSPGPYYVIPGNIVMVSFFTSSDSISSTHSIQDIFIKFNLLLKKQWGFSF